MKSATSLLLKSAAILSAIFLLVEGEEPKTDCTPALIGKDVQFEYRFPGYESYWLTHQPDGHWRPKVQWSHVNEVVKPEKGFTWRIHYCGNDQETNQTVVCMESLYPKWERYFIHGRELKYAATEDAITEDNKYHYRFECQNCDHSTNCEIIQVDDECKFYIDYKFFRGYEAYCKNDTDQPENFYRWYIKFAGKLNGDETVTIDEISNCSPGGQTLTKSVEFEEGSINTNTESHSHNIETGFEAIPGFKFFAELSGKLRISQKHEWSKISQTSIQTRKKSSLSVPVLPGQIATVWQSVLHYGNFEVKSAANYSTSSCPDHDTRNGTEAFDKDKVLGRVENCSPTGSKRGTSLTFKQGIINKNVNWHLNYVPLPADPALISEIEDSIKDSPNVKRKLEWSDLDLAEQLTQFQKSVEFTGAEGVEVPPGKVMTIYQLVLYYGKYTAYSGYVWYDLEDCPVPQSQIGATATSSPTNTRQLSIWIAVGVIGVLVLIILVVLVWRYRYKLAKRSRNIYELSGGPLAAAASTSQLSLASSRNYSYNPEYDNSKNTLVSNDPPSYNSFMNTPQ